MKNPLGFFVDKPNINRLVELVYHTISTFEPVCGISEMPLKKVHQTLKKSMTRNPHTETHTTGLTILCALIGRDVIQQLEIISNSPGNEEFTITTLLAVLFLGNDAMNLRNNECKESEIVEQLLSTI